MFIWLYKASLNGLSSFCLYKKWPETTRTLIQSALEQASGQIFCNQNEAKGLWELHRAYRPQLSACQTARWHRGPNNHLQREAGKSSHQFLDTGGKIQELTDPGMYFTVLPKCIWIAFSSNKKLKQDRNRYNAKWTSTPSTVFGLVFLFVLVFLVLFWLFNLHLFTPEIQTILFFDAVDKM